jgi:hypothetical protein
MCGVDGDQTQEGSRQMERILEPVDNPRRRLILLAILLLPILFTLRFTIVGLLISVAASFLPIMLTGTYRVTKVKGDRLFSQLFLGFMPMKPVKINLESVVGIHVRNAQQTGVGMLIMFGPVMFIFSHLMDYLLPSLGGSYEIHLETGKGRDVLVWSGHHQTQYEANLNYLKTRTDAEIHIRC